eukprot:403350910
MRESLKTLEIRLKNIEANNISLLEKQRQTLYSKNNFDLFQQSPQQIVKSRNQLQEGFSNEYFDLSNNVQKPIVRLKNSLGADQKNKSYLQLSQTNYNGMINMSSANIQSSLDSTKQKPNGTRTIFQLLVDSIEKSKNQEQEHLLQQNTSKSQSRAKLVRLKSQNLSKPHIDFQPHNTTSIMTTKDLKLKKTSPFFNIQMPEMSNMTIKNSDKDMNTIMEFNKIKRSNIMNKTLEFSRTSLSKDNFCKKPNENDFTMKRPYNHKNDYQKNDMVNSLETIQRNHGLQVKRIKQVDLFPDTSLELKNLNKQKHFQEQKVFTMDANTNTFISPWQHNPTPEGSLIKNQNYQQQEDLLLIQNKNELEQEYMSMSQNLHQKGSRFSLIRKSINNNLNKSTNNLSNGVTQNAAQESVIIQKSIVNRVYMQGHSDDEEDENAIEHVRLMKNTYDD